MLKRGQKVVFRREHQVMHGEVREGDVTVEELPDVPEDLAGFDYTLHRFIAKVAAKDGLLATEDPEARGVFIIH